MTFNIGGIAPELKDRPRWLLWKLINRNGKPTKVPFSAFGGTEWKDPAKWATFDQAIERFSQGGYSGIGFILGDGIVGIDFDKVLSPGKPEPDAWVKEP